MCTHPAYQTDIEQSKRNDNRQTESKNETGDTAFHEVGKYGYRNILWILVENGADLESQTQLATSSGHKGSAQLIATARLYHASADGDTAMVKKLIKEGACSGEKFVGDDGCGSI